jgi:peptide/nickel transport system permease protein
MLRQIITRLLATVPILFGISVFVFFMMHLAPGDVTDALLGPMATENAKAKLREAMGLDRPLVVQYASWIGNILQGDFGVSVHTKRLVSEVVLPRFVNTVIWLWGAWFWLYPSAFSSACSPPPGPFPPSIGSACRSPS